MIQLGANLLSSLATSAAEVSQTLVAGRGVRLERIVSSGQASPEGFWYDQLETEWVTVLAGQARIRVAGQAGDTGTFATTLTDGPAVAGDTMLISSMEATAQSPATPRWLRTSLPTTFSAVRLSS